MIDRYLEQRRKARTLALKAARANREHNAQYRATLSAVALIQWRARYDAARLTLSK